MSLVRSLTRLRPALRGLLLLTVVVLVTFSIALYGSFKRASDVADIDVRRNEQALVASQIERAKLALAENQKLQVTWNEAFRAAGKAGNRVNAKWADEQFGAFLWSNLKIDHLMLVAPNGDLLRSWRSGKPVTDGAWPELSGRVHAAQADMRLNRSTLGQAAHLRRMKGDQWPETGEGAPLVRWAGSLERVGGNLGIVTVLSIIPDSSFNGLDREPNSLVGVRMLDAQYLAELGTALNLEQLQWTDSPPAGSNAIELRNAQGSQIGWIAWTPHRVGELISQHTMPLLVSYLLFYILVLCAGTLIVRRALHAVGEAARREARAQRDALHDPMLGLPNRKLMMQRAERALKKASGDQAVFIAYIDLDHFKAINEAMGHPVGDEVLAKAVSRLKGILRPEDTLARLASDEFVVVQSAPGGKDQAARLGDRILSVFTEPFEVQGNSLSVSASCGIAWAPEQAKDANELLRLANIALHRAKQRGRGRFRYFTDDMTASIRWRQDMEAELRRAIAGKGLEMHYQPIIHVAGRKIVSFEALLRWNHPDRGAISPGTFVPLAENCGLMPQLGEWVLRRVFTDSARLGDCDISVNLSPLQISARDFVPHLKAILAEHKVETGRYVFEITEGVLMENSERTLSVLGELRELGFRVALDDFGTGFSSLSYLRSFQFDHIKIDRSFVQGIESDLDAQAILKAIVNLGRTLRMKVVAEGVETLLQQQLVEAAGCELIQGHLHSRAVRLSRAAAMVPQESTRVLSLERDHLKLMCLDRPRKSAG